MRGLAVHSLIKKRRHLGRDVQSSVTVGLVMALIYSLVVVLVSVSGGFQRFAAHGTTMSAVIATYLVTGIAGGVVVGILKPWTASLLGRSAVGLIVAFIAFFNIEIASEGPFWGWSAASWKTVLVLSTFFGVAGAYAWAKFTRPG
jgi:hypothetical protein